MMLKCLHATASWKMLTRPHEMSTVSMFQTDAREMGLSFDLHDSPTSVVLTREVQGRTWGYCGLLDLIVLCQEQCEKMCGSQQVCGGTVVDLHLHQHSMDVSGRCL